MRVTTDCMMTTLIVITLEIPVAADVSMEDLNIDKVITASGTEIAVQNSTVIQGGCFSNLIVTLYS